MTVSIAKSVGRNGANRKKDTPLKTLDPSYHHRAALAIDVYRMERKDCTHRRFMNNPDARVDPGGRTLRRLNAAAPGRQPDWGGDSSKWAQEKKLASLDPRLRPKVEAILAVLKTQGFKPKLFMPGVPSKFSTNWSRRVTRGFGSAFTMRRPPMAHPTLMRSTSSTAVGPGIMQRS